MGYIGKIPSAVPLTSADITDNVITSAKIVDGTIALADLSATGTKNSTTFLRGDNTFATAGGVNTPAFLVGRNADQTISTATETKVQFNNESYDSDNNFDSTTNYRFTPTTAGKYFLTANIILDINESVNIVYMGIRKNSTNIAVNRRSHTYGTERQTLQVSVIADANGSTDYFEVIVYHARGSNVTLVNDTAWVFFHGFKLIT